MDTIYKHVSHLAGNILARVDDPFARDIAGLSEATATEIIELRDGEAIELRAAPVRKRIGEAIVKMLAYNSSVPGPTLKVPQGSEVTINFTNAMELPTTVHWHGLRLDNRFDGVPQDAHHGVQPAIPGGGRFAYRLRFPDPGVYWYHPHVREDYTQEHGLYGNIIVTPRDPAYWSPVNRELALFLDDILIERGKIAPFSQTESNRTAMGRFGNVMLINGETSYTLMASRGEVIRLYLTNAANVRPFNVHIPGARMKLVGSDSGRVEHEEFIDAVMLAPSERAIVDVLFEQAGQFSLEHHTPDRTYLLGTVDVHEQPAAPAFAREFAILRQSEELTAERARIEPDVHRAPDKIITLVGEMPGMQGHGEHHVEAIEWEDTMELHNRMSTPKNMIWKVVDQATGNANQDIQWSFTVGERVKIRIINNAHSDHPMQHPVHFHGQCFLILSRDGAPNNNLAWKDTALLRAGETVDVLLDMTNPGVWMAHCHIAEHLEGGMMLSFHVDDRAGNMYHRSGEDDTL